MDSILEQFCRSRKRRLPRGGCSAFSLIEMLTVIAIMAILVGLTVPSIRGIKGASALSVGGNQLSGIIDSARENAILRKEPTAVVMLVNSAKGPAYRAVCALQYVPATTSPVASAYWQQITKWTFLPDGVVVEPSSVSGSPTTFTSSPTVTPALPNGSASFAFQGQALSSGDYTYQIFLGDGRPFQDSNGNPPSPCLLQLVEGNSGSAGVQLTGVKNGSGLPVNYYDIVINDATGRTKINRPGM